MRNRDVAKKIKAAHVVLVEIFLDIFNEDGKKNAPLSEVEAVREQFLD